MKVEVYSDIACPWCYVGKRRFEHALSAFPKAAEVEVVYRPYQLDPGAPTTASSHREYLNRRYGPDSARMDARVAGIGAGEGIAFDFDRALHVNTLDGHRMLRLAELEYGPQVQLALAEKLFAARFAEGGNVGDREQLVELAAAAGMDRERAAAYLASDEGAKDVLEQIEEARALGISSVPTFVFEDQWAVTGAQETSTFLRVLEQIAAQTSGPDDVHEQEHGRGHGHDHADGEACSDGMCAV